MHHTPPSASKLHAISATGLLVTIGIVFGDIGTSPLYVMKAIVGANPGFAPDYIIGAVSCVIWTLTLQTTVKYVLLALRADNRGEGGILALFALLRHIPRRWTYIVAAIGASALVADGIITPAITVTSAMEGLNEVLEDVPVVPIVIPYPSLRKCGIPGDFRFVILHRIFSPDSSCAGRSSLLMRLHQKIRHIGISDQSALGLDTSVVTCETVPLVINTCPGTRIKPIPLDDMTIEPTTGKTQGGSHGCA